MLLAAAGTRECRQAGRVPHAALRIDWSPRTISPSLPLFYLLHYDVVCVALSALYMSGSIIVIKAAL
jgi:hypothetical protein